MNSTVAQILKYYNALEKNEDPQWVVWSETRKRFTKKSADAFFIAIMLDQGQKTEVSWDGAMHLVANYFQNKRVFGKLSLKPTLRQLREYVKQVITANLMHYVSTLTNFQRGYVALQSKCLKSTKETPEIFGMYLAKMSTRYMIVSSNLMV